MDNLYKFSKETPFHFSAGAILFNNKNEICVHRYHKDKIASTHRHLMGGLENIYVLMRETLQDNESIETAVLRGVQEEFGAMGEIDNYIGTIVCDVESKRGFTFEKSTAYHSVKLVALNERDETNPENFSDMVWLTPDELIKIMETQEKSTDREELHESIIIKRFKQLLTKTV